MQRMNLFFITGLPNQGKTTLAKHLHNNYDSLLITTDTVFKLWCRKNYPKETKAAVYLIFRNFHTVPAEIQREWHEYLTNHILSKLECGYFTIIAEGWLLGILPDYLREVLESKANLFPIKMVKYVAHTPKATYQAYNNCENVAKEIYEEFTNQTVER